MYCVFHLELIKSKYKKGAFESVYYTVFDPIYPTKTSHSFSSGAVWEHKIAIVPQEHDSSPCNSFFSLFFYIAFQNDAAICAVIFKQQML